MISKTVKLGDEIIATINAPDEAAMERALAAYTDSDYSVIDTPDETLVRPVKAKADAE